MVQTFRWEELGLLPYDYVLYIIFGWEWDSRQSTVRDECVCLQEDYGDVSCATPT